MLRKRYRDRIVGSFSFEYIDEMAAIRRQGNLGQGAFRSDTAKQRICETSSSIDASFSFEARGCVLQIVSCNLTFDPGFLTSCPVKGGHQNRLSDRIKPCSRRCARHRRSRDYLTGGVTLPASVYDDLYGGQRPSLLTLDLSFTSHS